MKKEILFITIITLLLFSVSCSSNKVRESKDVNYEQRETERKTDKAFRELDEEVKKIRKEEKEQK